MRKTPQIYVEHHDGGWAVQELDAPPTARRFKHKTVAEAVARSQASQKAADLVVLDMNGRIERWESSQRRSASRPGPDCIG